MTQADLETETVLQVLFAVAWSDGHLAEAEHRMLKEIYERVEVGRDVSKWFDSPPETPKWNQLRADDDTSEALLRQAMHVAAVDDTVRFEENWLMDRLRGQLGISDARFHDIQQEVEQQRA